MPFVQDTFTDTDDTKLEDHSPDVGGSWVRRSGAYSTTIQSNKAQGGSDLSYYTNSASPSTSEYDVEDDLTHGNAYCGVLGRCADVSNFYRARLFGSDLQLHKRVSGSFTLLDSAAYTPPATFTMKLEIRTAAKKVYADDVEKLSSADDSLTAKGNPGIYFFNTTALHDNFLAEDVGAPPPVAAFMKPGKYWGA